MVISWTITNPMGWWKMPVAGSGDLLISRSERESQKKSSGHHLNVGFISSKTLKGPWTHHPDEKSLENVSRRLRLCRALCDEVDILSFLGSVSSII